MEMRPEEAFLDAVEAMVLRDGVRLAQRLDNDSLARWRDEQVRTARSAAFDPEDSGGYLERVLHRFNVGSLTELEALDKEAMLQITLRNLPVAARALRVEYVEFQQHEPDRGTIVFRILIADIDPDARPRTAGMRYRRELGWRIIASPVSQWILPGFENILLGEGSR